MVDCDLDATIGMLEIMLTDNSAGKGSPTGSHFKHNDLTAGKGAVVLIFWASCLVEGKCLRDLG